MADYLLNYEPVQAFSSSRFVSLRNSHYEVITQIVCIDQPICYHKSWMFLLVTKDVLK